jgi:hypothetical protein
MENSIEINYLKVGIVLDSYKVTKWIEKIISQINLSTYIKATILIFNQEPSNKKVTHLSKVNSYNNLYTLYSKLDYKHYSTKIQKNAFAKINLKSYLDENFKYIHFIKPEFNKVCQQDLDSLRNENLDVILHFGNKETIKDLSKVAKYGVWFYPHDHFEEGYFKESNFFNAMFERKQPLVTSLNILMDGQDKSTIIYKSNSPVSSDSLFFNCNSVYWKTSEFIMRRLNDLYERGFEYIVSDSETDPISIIKEGNYIPKNSKVIKLLYRFLLEKIKSRFFYEQWIIAYKTTKRNKEDYVVIKPPIDRFYADPFVIKRKDKNFIFFEEYIYSKGKGDISVFEIDTETKEVSEAITVLEKPYHLSYPFIYEWDGETYMVPETSGNRTIELYKATNFPYNWDLQKVLIDNINAVDATIIHYNDKFWMFANVFVDGASSLDELYIFHADTLLGEWKPHKMNPVISDASSARPAGKIYLKDGKLIRPSQDCTFSYGYAIKLNEIVELNEQIYKERTISEIKPNWLKDNRGTHTYNFNEDIEIIDGRLLERNRYKLKV